MNQSLRTKSFLAVLACCFAFNAEAQVSLPKDVVAIVNGKQISAKLLDQNIKANTAQGLNDSQELRKALTDELINRELLAQAAQKKNLHNDPEVQLQLEQLQKNLLADLATNDYLKNKSITEDQLKSEYQLQIQALGDTRSMQQYKIRQILLSNESDARTVLNRLKKESFEKVAQEVSIDTSRDRGGDLGWVLPNQVIPIISNVMVNLNKGNISQAPIQTNNGWHIIRVDDKRPFKVPAYEESKDRVRISLLQKMRAEYIAQLRQDAKIQP
jgi:peptidyl-prolyl cis-trans isomerase C